MKRIGLIINPVAGLGGSVGLKGTDGMIQEALDLGAVPRANEKAKRALKVLLSLKNNLIVYCCGKGMGADVLADLGFSHKTVYEPQNNDSSALDTQQGARQMLAADVDLIAFVGGDGSARDIFEAIGEAVPVVGIPAGVKIQSPVYAQSPEKAGELLYLYLTGKTIRFKENEVIDIDEEAYRNDVLSSKLYGYLNTPLEHRFMQSKKTPSPNSEKDEQVSIATSIAGEMDTKTQYLVGPGSTTRSFMKFLGLSNTLLGVDLLKDRDIIAHDLNENQILAYMGLGPTKLIITPTGGQGYLLGRGNQQISPDVIQRLGKENIIVAATKNKLSSLRGAPLRVDTGDFETDALLRGYIRVVVGYRETIVYRIE